MSARNRPAVGGRPVRAGWVIAVVVAGLAATGGRAQSPPQGLASLIPTVAPSTPGSGVVQASGCSSCGTPGGMPGGPGIWGYGKHPVDPCLMGDCGAEGCGENGCVPGRPPCYTCDGHNRVGRLFCAIHNALCCPDPCYEPRWNCPAAAALFVDYTRPATVTRIRWDAGVNLINPDRAEYFWAAANQKGPRPETSVNYHELRFYQEAGTGSFSAFIDVPYRTVDPDINGGAGGFGDMVIGTKSMLLDSELVQLTFQLTTSIPMGVASRGIGIGHVAMDPSLLWTVKLYPDTYWQSQLGYWIPISGTDGFAGSVLHYHNSVNHVLCRPLPDVAFVGTIECVGYTFTAGRFTDPTGAVFSANDQTYFSIGPGFRLCVCDKLDIGFGMQFSVTNPHFAEQLYRTELRYRY